MFKLTGKDILKAYAKTKNSARIALRRNKVEKSLRYIELSAKVAYSYNYFYADEELEEILNEVSQRIITNDKEFVPLQNHYVFYDYAGQDHRGLTQQYLRAFMSMDVHILYILEYHTPELNKEIFAELTVYPKASFLIIDKSRSLTNQILQVYSKIVEFRPDKIFMHLFPWDVVAVSVFNRIRNATRYQINLTDHTFWLGVKCSDFVLEFRDYGATISLQKRHIPLEKLLKLPYYPVIDCAPFQGLPFDIEKHEHVIIFTGGSLYKTLGDNYAFYEIIKNILKANQEVILLLAGNGSGMDFIRKFIVDNGFESRMFLLGNRADINYLFAISDIYLGTYPLCGGLMTQYAAFNGKPILAYTDKSIECNQLDGILYNVPEDLIVTHTDKNAFYAEAERLIRDKAYREEIGRRLRNCVIKNNDFKDKLQAFIMKPDKKDTIVIKNIDYERFAELNLEVENEFSAFCRKSILKEFRLRAFWYFPKQTFSYMFSNSIYTDLKKIF